MTVVMLWFHDLKEITWGLDLLGFRPFHYSDVIMSMMASQITRLMIVYSTVFSGTDQRKHQSSASLAFVRGIHRWLVNSPHKWPVKCFHLMTSSCSAMSCHTDYLYKHLSGAVIFWHISNPYCWFQRALEDLEIILSDANLIFAKEWFRFSD